MPKKQFIYLANPKNYTGNILDYKLRIRLYSKFLKLY